jgi:hypothetical protein
MENHAKDQAIAQAHSIIRMVAALNVDFDRLEELREELQELSEAYDNAESDEEKANANQELCAWQDEYAEELAELEAEAGGCESREDAEQDIQDDPLSIQVRSGWVSLGEEMQPEEFEIILCAGGPAVRILGELDAYNQPCRAWIEYQDWGTAWTQLFGEIEQETLLKYCQQFYFGE